MSSISKVKSGLRDLYEYPVFGDLGTYDAVVLDADVPTDIVYGVSTKGWEKIIVHVAINRGGGAGTCTLEPRTWQGWDHTDLDDRGTFVVTDWMSDLTVAAGDNDRKSFIVPTFGTVIWYRVAAIDAESLRITVSGVKKLVDDIS